MKSRQGSDELRVSSSASTTRQNERNEKEREEMEGERGNGSVNRRCIVNLHSGNMRPWRREGDEWVMENGRQEEKRER